MDVGVIKLYFLQILGQTQLKGIGCAQMKSSEVVRRKAPRELEFEVLGQA